MILSQVLFLSGCKEETMLLTKIDQYQVNKIISTLQSNGIESSKVANKKGDTFNIVLDKSDLSNATIILSAKGPFMPSTKLGNPCDFKGLISTPSEEKQCKKHRLETELERTLGQIDGVLNADVHIVMSKKGQSGFDMSFNSSSAAVFIKHQKNIDLSLFKTSIKRLVEKSIPGLTYDKVSLVLIPALATSLKNITLNNNQENSNGLVMALIVSLIISWLAFFFKEQLLKTKFLNNFHRLSHKTSHKEKAIDSNESPELG
jgi:type III secretion protein J